MKDDCCDVAFEYKFRGDPPPPPEEKKDSDAPIEFTFRHCTIDDPELSAVPKVVEDGRWTTLELRRFPGRPEVKRRHYYIYSDEAGYGKTHFLSVLEKTANACFITDPGNLSDVRESAQLLLLDEAAPDRCLSFADLKALCSGSGFRPDVQVVICSAVCPYSLYGDRDDETRGYRVMGEAAYSAFNERFHVVKLDGNLSEDRAKFLDPAMLTRAEGRVAVAYHLREKNLFPDDKRVAVSVMLRRLAKAVATAVSFIDQQPAPPFYSIYEMFEYFDLEYSVAWKTGGLSWYEIGTRVWFEDGERKPGIDKRAVIHELCPEEEQRGPSIEWIAEQARSKKNPGELSDWLRRNYGYRAALADFYKSELGEQREIPDEQRLRRDCLELHRYGSKDADVYAERVWPLVREYMRKRPMGADGEVQAELNPDSSAEPIGFTFRRRNDGPTTGLELRRFPGKPEIKRRHYYIYSDEGGYGKTRFLSLLEKTANACFITDPGNLSDVRETAQLLLLDDAAPDRCLSFADLKALCVRSDVQLVICSRVCPYSLYGDRRDDEPRGYRVMGEAAYSSFSERFHVIKLDGDLSLDRVKFLEPALLTPEEKEAREAEVYAAVHVWPFIHRSKRDDDEL